MPNLTGRTAPLISLLLPNGQILFFIQRNKNENTIAYDANLNAKGEFNNSKPIDAYWLRYTSTGYRRELSWLERTFAYGYGSKKRNGKLEVELVAYDDRKIYLEKNEDGKPIALLSVKGKKCRLDYLYVFADESGSWPKIIHLDIHATELATGKKIKERILND